MRAPRLNRNETGAQGFSPELEQGQFRIEFLESTFPLKPFIEESAVENCKPFISCGHFLGFSHSAVWSVMMFPCAPAPGTISGTRPTTLQPDAPLGDDDRTGLRILYPDPADTLHQGSISGRIIPANPLALPAFPPGVTGVFGAHIVAVDNATGAVIGATLGGWSCAAPGPTQFDGS